MNIHNLIIVKRSNERTDNSIPLTLAEVRELHTREEISKATCSCGWSGDWHSTEQAAIDEYSKHIGFVHFSEQGW